MIEECRLERLLCLSIKIRYFYDELYDFHNIVPITFLRGCLYATLPINISKEENVCRNKINLFKRRYLQRKRNLCSNLTYYFATK